MKKTHIKAFLIAVFAVMLSGAVSASDNGSAGSFLFAGSAGARAAALGSACSAYCTDSSAAYYNPALITYVKFTELTFYYTTPMEGIAYDVLSFALPIGEYGILAFSRVELASDGLERIDADGIKTGDFSDRQNAYMLSYGYSFGGTLSLGATLKLVTRSFDRQNANGFGIDIGALYELNDTFSASLALQNALPPSVKTGDTAENYPVNIRLGAALRFFDSWLNIMGDALLINLFPDGGDFTGGRGKMYYSFSGGIEGRPFGFTALRAGISQAGPALGAGITTENFTVDYAVTFAQLGILHNFGLTARFGLVPTEREKKLENEKKKLEQDKSRLLAGLSDMTNEQILLSALNDYNTGAFEQAAIKVKALLDKKSTDPLVKKLDSDVRLALNKKAAAAIYDDGVALMVKGEKVKGLELIKAAEKKYPGITEVMNKEYMERCEKEINARNYENAKACFINILAVDPSNAKAVEMLEKIQELINMMKKTK